ncbi:MAG: helix-turn-helix transcriptional regulator [Roseburia sp.]|nr:helix-turn-helix transcriptional regulator [Roseburia sp.]
MKLRLRELRNENGYTQDYLAKYLSIKQNTYSQYESGVREIPLECVCLLAKLYDTSIDYILNLTDDERHYRK